MSITSDNVNRYDDTVVLPIHTRLEVGTIVKLKKLVEQNIDITIKDPTLMTEGVGDAVFDASLYPSNTFDPQ